MSYRGASLEGAFHAPDVTSVCRRAVAPPRAVASDAEPPGAVQGPWGARLSPCVRTRGHGQQNQSLVRLAGQ